MRTRMHDDEVLTDARLARALLAEQHPRWADHPLHLVDSYGTDHDVYTLGDRLSLRLPRTAWAATQATKEATWLPMLASLPLAVPQVVALGEPTSAYPFRWSVQTWVPGADLTGGVPDDGVAVAGDLAAFVRSLRGLPTTGAPPLETGARGGSLATHEHTVRARIAQVGEVVDPAAMTRAWQESLTAAATARTCWTHGDLLPGNVLAAGGRLTGVIDWGALNVTDPALDLTPCWYLFDGVASGAAQRYLGDLDATEADVLRARGWAQLQALNALPYYRETNPGMAALARGALTLIAREAG